LVVSDPKPGPGPAVRTETIIEAPPERVWEILVDVGRWHEWNPTFFDVREGTLAPGHELRMNLQLGPLKVPMRQQVRTVDPPRELVWRSKQLVPAAAFDVIRSFRLEPAGEGRTRLVQSEHLFGYLAPLMARLIGKLVAKGYENLGRALGERVADGKR
jgi:hypothetical protein